MKTIIVETWEQLRRAIELEEADEIIIKGMIACQYSPLIVKQGQKLVGFNSYSGLIFKYEKAQSAILLEGGMLDTLKIEVLAETYPAKERMQAVVEINAYHSALKDVTFDIWVKDPEVSCMHLQYSGLYIRHEAVLAGTIKIKSRGHNVVPIADCPLATSAISGDKFSLLLEGSVKGLQGLEIRGQHNMIALQVNA